MKQKLLVLLALVAFSWNLFGQNPPKFTISSEKYIKFIQIVDTSIWLVNDKSEVEQYTRKGKLIKSLTYKNESFYYNASCFYIANDGTIWVGADGGLAVYDGHNWKYFTDAIGNSDVSVIQPVGTDMWIGTESAGAFKFSDFEMSVSVKKLSPSGISQDVISICAAANGDIWIGVYGYSNGGILRYSNNTVTVYGKPKGLLSGYVSKLVSDPSGDIWIATTSEGIFRWRAAEDSLFQYSTNKGLAHKDVREMLVDQYDTLWVASQTGLSKYVSDVDTMISYTAKNSTINADIRPNHLLTFGDSIAISDGNGFSIFDRTTFKSHTKFLNISNYSGRIVSGGDSLFYVSAYGTAVLHDGALSMFCIGKLGNNFTDAVQSPDGNLWYIAQYHQITMLDTLGQWHHYPRIFGNSIEYSIMNLSFNPNGEVWLATDLGFAVYRKGTWDTVQLPIHSVLKEKTITDVSFLDADSYSVATDGGLYYFNNGDVKAFTTDNGMYSNSFLQAAFAPDSSLWAVAYDYDNNKDEVCKFKNNVFTSFSSQNTFDMRRCSSLAFDSNGNPWFSSLYGDAKLITFNGTKWLNYSDSLVSGNEGIADITFNREGELWGVYDYPKSVFSFNGKHFTHYDRTNTPVFDDFGYLHKITVDKSDNLLIPCTNFGVVTIDKPIRVAFSSDTVCVGLKTKFTSTTEPQVNRYKWELVGESGNSVIGSDPVINYIFNSSGEYTVKLTVYDAADSNWVSHTIKRSPINPYSEPLKLVTAADKDDKMIVVWDKTPGKGTASYNIYRLEAEGFIKVGSKLFSEPSFFYDAEANYKERAHTYKITTVDNCGTESAIDASNEHTSMHLLLIPYGRNFQMIWSKYVGVANPKYIVLESSKTGEDTVRLATLPSINNSYTVLKYNSNKAYRVAIDLGYSLDPLNSGLKSDSGPFSQSLSNISESIVLEGVMLSNGFNAIVYPVPATDFCSVLVDESLPSDYIVTLTNADGKTVYSQSFAGVCKLDETISLKDFARGNYILTILSPNGTNTTTVVVQ